MGVVVFTTHSLGTGVTAGLVFPCSSARVPLGVGPWVREKVSENLLIEKWTPVVCVSGVTAAEELWAGSYPFKSAGGQTWNTSLRFPRGRKVRN